MASRATTRATTRAAGRVRARRRRRPPGARLVVPFTLVALVPVLIGAVLVQAVLPRVLAHRTGTRLAMDANRATALIDDLCERAGVAASVVAGSASPGLTASALAGSVVTAGLADYVQVTDATGTAVFSAGELPVAAGNGGITTGGATAGAGRDLGDCANGKDGNPYALAVQVAVLGPPPGRQAMGTATAAIGITPGLADNLRTALGADVTLVAGQRILATTLPAVQAALAAGALRDAESSPQRVQGFVVTAAGSTPNRPFATVLTARPPGVGSRLPLAALGLLPLLLAGLVGRRFARVRAGELAELADGATRIAAGDVDTSIRVRSGGDIGAVVAAVNQLTAQVRAYAGALGESRDELQRNLTRLGETLSGTHDLDRILAVILDTAMAGVHAQAGAVLLTAATHGELYVAGGQGLAERGVPDSPPLRLRDGIAATVATTGAAVHGRMGAGPGELRRAPDEPAADTLIAVPLSSSGRVIGVLTLYDRVGGRDFDESDVATIQTFAAQATVAIDNVLLHQEAQRLAITDGLTGVWNYRYLMMTLGKEIERASRFERPLGLLVLDLDRFKNVNDTYGHQRGDAVLVEVAARVRGEIREVDTLARYGGEEFVLVLPEAGIAGAKQAARRLLDVIRSQPFGQPGENPVDITVSIGIAVFPNHGTTAKALLSRADEALYRVKDAGRDGWQLATAADGPRSGTDASGGPSTSRKTSAAARVRNGAAPPPVPGAAPAPEKWQAAQSGAAAADGAGPAPSPQPGRPIPALGARTDGETPAAVPAGRASVPASRPRAPRRSGPAGARDADGVRRGRVASRLRNPR